MISDPNVYAMLTGRNLYQDWKRLLVTKIADIPTIVTDFINQGWVPVTGLSYDTSARKK